MGCGSICEELELIYNINSMKKNKFSMGRCVALGWVLFISGVAPVSAQLNTFNGALIVNNALTHTYKLDIFFGIDSGEGILSKRKAGDNNRYGLDLCTNFTPRLSITNSGNVGVNTLSASAKLHVYDAAEPTIKIESAADGLPALKFAEAGLVKWAVLNNNDDRLVFRSTAGGVSADQVVLDPAGNVGIGTATPSHKLAVNGAIRAKEIIVDTSWADDVFAPDYRLASLAEVEQHIQAKGYLPAVPSAAEVAEKGISVGESQALLLRKVEELTLHIIALNKQVQAQQKRLMELEAVKAIEP